uniref:Uncharacterized protein n=1 Tax=Rhizophora mucronata TaxID=61149 RepID=A0A2P2KW32_RHIMU
MTTSFIDITVVKGRENAKRDLVNKLLSRPSGGDGSDLRILFMVGMGGIGKTCPIYL